MDIKLDSETAFRHFSLLTLRMSSERKKCRKLHAEHRQWSNLLANSTVTYEFCRKSTSVFVLYVLYHVWGSPPHVRMCVLLLLYTV